MQLSQARPGAGSIFAVIGISPALPEAARLCAINAGGNCGRSLNLGRGNHGRGASLHLTRLSRAQTMARDGMSRELYAEMLGYLGLPAGIAMMACRSSRPLQPCPVKSC